MANADGYVLPKPGIPKTLGILNIIFGVLLVLLGLCGIVTMAAAPALMGFAEKSVKDVQSKVEAQNKANEKVYDDRIAAAKTDEEKKAIEQEKANAIAAQPKFAQMDLSAATDVLKNPTIMAVTYAGSITGLILHVILLISGIGLIRLAPWGRTLAVWWGVLQIFQVIILLMANILIVMPVNKPISDKQIAKLEENAKANPNSPEAATLPMTKAMAGMAVPMAIGQSLGGMIYPAIVLILLNTAGAKAACMPRKPEGEGEF